MIQIRVSGFCCVYSLYSLHILVLPTGFKKGFPVCFCGNAAGFTLSEERSGGEDVQKRLPQHSSECFSPGKRTNAMTPCNIQSTGVVDREFIRKYTEPRRCFRLLWHLGGFRRGKYSHWVWEPFADTLGQFQICYCFVTTMLLFPACIVGRYAVLVDYLLMCFYLYSIFTYVCCYYYDLYDAHIHDISLSL